MAESYSVKAILSAQDRGFTSTIRSALGSVESLGSKIKSGFAFGLLQGAGQAAFNSITSGIRDMASEMNSASATWQTFEGNMAMLGMSAKSIASVKTELQAFAQETIYSASDMASTYSQLAAVGTKNCTELVKGFGGLAAAAENPQQAMKTLSQQATQMAAKPKVQWMDFKLMLEQTPAGIAAVARQMGMTTSELIANIQDGEVATEDFFDAITKVAGSGSEFEKLATQYKTVGQAMDGLKETAANKLMPAFQAASKVGIKAVESIIGSMEKIDGEALAAKVTGALDTVKSYFGVFKSEFQGVSGYLSSAFGSIKTAFAKANGIFGDTTPLERFKIVCHSVAGAIQTASAWISDNKDRIAGWIIGLKPYFEVAKNIASTVVSAIGKIAAVVGKVAASLMDFFTKNSAAISKLIPYVIGLAAAFKGFNIIKALVPGMASFASSIAKMASGGIKGLAAKLFGVASGETAAGTAASTSAKDLLAAGAAFLMIGAGVALVAGGFVMLANSAIQLANAGGLAIGVMAGLAIGVVAVGAGMALLLKSLAPMAAQLLPAAVAMLAMGAAVVLVAAGFALMAYSAIQLSSAGGSAIAVMAGMVVTMALLAVGAAALGTALTAGAIGFIAFGAAIVLVGAGALLAAAALSVVAGVLPIIAAYGTQGAVAITLLGAGLLVFAAGAAVAGAACVVLGAGLTVAAAGALVAAAGVLALGAAAAVLGAALLLSAASVTMMAAVFPVATAGATMITAAFAALVGVSAALGASLLVVNAPLLLIGASSLAASAGILAFGVAMTTGAAGALLMAAALKGIQSSMKSISSSAKTAESSLSSMESSVSAVQSGLDALGSKAKSAMQSLTSAFDNAAEKAKSAGTKLGNGFSHGMEPGLAQAPDIANQAVDIIVTTFMSGYGAAYSAGAYIGMGLANGMESMLWRIRMIANQMVYEANRAMEAAAMIGSPSKITTKYGKWYGQGYVNGIKSKINDAKQAAKSLFSVPTVATPQLAGAYGGELSADYDYYRNAEYTIIVPLAVDGREFARATATYTQDELNKRQTRDNRKRGKV